LGGPSRTVAVFVNTFGFVSGTKFVVFDFHSGGGFVGGGFGSGGNIGVASRDSGTPNVGGTSTGYVVLFGDSTLRTLGGSVLVDGIKTLLASGGVGREGNTE
jgi:hypothetical protein